jgi:uncharacterized protein YjlB
LLRWFRSGVSEEGSDFKVEAHFHPNSAEHFVIMGGQAHFTIDGGDEQIIEEGGHFFIPRGVIHTVSSPKGEYMAFKVRGDHDPVAERDFLMQMFTLIETVSVCEHCLTVNYHRLIAFGGAFRTSMDC